MPHLTPEILVRSWKGTYSDLLTGLDDLGADLSLDGFRVQGMIWTPWGDLHDDTPWWSHHAPAISGTANGCHSPEP